MPAKNRKDGRFGEMKFNMAITEDGIIGEQLLFKLLKQKGFKIFQPDAIGFINGKYHLFECKHQEHYKSPPFDGHGLPKWQIEARLKFQRETGIIAILVVFEKPIEKTNLVYYQSLEILEKGEKYPTRGNQPRIIYPLTNFKNCKLN